MKLRFTKEKFLDGLQQVQNVVSTRSTLPILSNTLIRTHKNEISLTTTDLDVGVRCPIEADVVREGGITLPARRLFTIIRELAHSEVELEVDGAKIDMEKLTLEKRCRVKELYVEIKYEWDRKNHKFKAIDQGCVMDSAID